MRPRPPYQVGDMAQPDTGKGSFFGRFVYERIVPQDHFLVALDHLFDWQGISEQLIGSDRAQVSQGILSHSTPNRLNHRCRPDGLPSPQARPPTAKATISR